MAAHVNSRARSRYVASHRAAHAFTNPQADDREFGTVYDTDADRRSWAEMRAFFAEVLC